MIANDTQQRPYMVDEESPILLALNIVISLFKLPTNILHDQSDSIVYMSIVKRLHCICIMTT